uniref:Superoxide dismutase n=1 Tax=Tetraselmis sp. GSL018 TaxID=582737 RepID=A0A061R2L0_9CHLO
MASRLFAASGNSLSRCLASGAHIRQFSAVTLPDLPYDYSALEPAISGEIMELHHSKHHQTYVNNLTIALEKSKEAKARRDLAAQIALQDSIKFNGGGHVNHSIFWTNLCPAKDFEPPSGELADALVAQFGSVEAFQQKFSATTAAVQGSGWGWLGYDKEAQRLVIETTANQDPLSTKGLVPLLGIDVWEHAYYLQYKNKRPDYLKAVWEVVNWKNVAERYAAAQA